MMKLSPAARRLLRRSMPNRITRLLLTGALLGGCTLEAMQQLSGPQAAEKHEHVEWPEVQPLADDASDAYAHNMQATVLASHLTARHWEEQTNERGHRERTTGLRLYINRRGGAAVKGAEGEDGVCFVYGCSLVQERSDDRWQAPFLECPNGNLQKVTCKSVAEITGGPVATARPAPQPAVKPTPAAAAPPPPQPAPPPPQTPPFGTYRGDVNLTMTTGGKKERQTGKTEMALIDLGGDKVDVVTGPCHANAKRTGSTIKMEPGQSCAQGGTEVKDMKGTFKLLGGDKLDIALEMTLITSGETSTLRSSGVLKLKHNH